MRSWLLQIDEDKEAKKLEAARAVLAGRSFTEGEEDPFEGLGPHEIQAYIDKALDGVSHSDPFEVRPPAVAVDAMTTGMLFPSNVPGTTTSLQPHFNQHLYHGVSLQSDSSLSAYHMQLRHKVRWQMSQASDCKSFLVQGMTPEEINDYTAKNGVPAQYQ